MTRQKLAWDLSRAAALLTSWAVLVFLAPGGRDALAAPVPPSGSLSLSNPVVPWTGGSIVGANADESTCQEDATCETFHLTLEPGDYTEKRITFEIHWLLPSNDYDFYVHAGTPDGPVVVTGGSGASNFENKPLDLDPPVVTEPQEYFVRIVAFAVAPGDNYAGSAALTPAPPPREPIYLSGDKTFSQNVALRAPVAYQDGEPSIRVDVEGTCYVGGIRGVPAGVDLWRFDIDPTSPTFDPGMQSPTYLGQPDAFLHQDPADSTAGGADGGGDIDISVSFPDNPDSIPVLTISSLAAANISSASSFDRGENFTLNPAVALVPGDDRQWNECFGHSRVYLSYRAPIPATGLFMAISDDHGFSYPIQTVISPSGSSPGYLDVDHANGNVYVSHQNGSALFVAASTDQGLTWRNSSVDNAGVHGELFDPVKVGDDGTVYTVWCDAKNIYMRHSTDAGVTWSTRVRVNDNSVYQTNLEPWLEAGSDGRVNVVWYGTTSDVNSNDADWVVLFTQTLNAKDQNPTFHQQVISDHVIHASNISTGGLDPVGGANRNLIDYFQVALDPQGAAVVAFTDDHNDYAGHTYVTRQLDGISLYEDANGTGLVNPVYPPPLPEPDPLEPEVSDFLHDAVTGLLQPIEEDNPFDILWIDYSCEESQLPNFQGDLLVTMKVSGLPAVPPQAFWRMMFAANAPEGTADRGDQFFLRAASGDVTPLYTWGTVVRDGDGGFTYTQRGNADFGEFDTVAGTISVRVSFDALNQYVTHGPPISFGSVLHGLKGETFTGAGLGASDITRGGVAFQCGAASTVPEAKVDGPGAIFLGRPNPNPSSAGSSVRFQVARAGFVELSVFDVRGRRVRTIQAGRLAPGEYVRTWDGRTDRFSDAAPGVYFYILNTSGGRESEKITLLP